MLRSAVRGACLLLALVAACKASPVADEVEVSSSLDEREKRTYGHYHPANCGKPGAPQNGWTIYGGLTAGNKALHHCKPGFLLVGAKLRICQSNGRWTPDLPQCKLVDCGDPGEPANGMKWLGSTTLGSYVKYKCLEGYQLKGYSYRKCLSTGLWYGHLPTCEPVGCPELEDPANGDVKVVDIWGVLTAQYTCDEGYVLKGSPTRKCVGGVWQPEAPVCQLVDCGFLDPPDNGVVEFKSTVFRSIARYQCNPGYVLQGSELRTCQADGQWSGVPPSCAGRIRVGYEPIVYTTTEGIGKVELNIAVLSHPISGSPRPFTISVTTQDGSAVAPNDYEAVNRQPIKFETGDTSKTHIITINQDVICEDEQLESFFSKIVLESGVQPIDVTQPQATVYIDDSQEPECDEIVVGYDPTAYTTSEGEGRVELNIAVFSHPVRGTPRPFTLSVTTTDGSANAPDDYEAVRREIIEFNTGDTSQTHIIFINPDDICEDGSLEKFYSNIVLEIGQQVRVSPPRAIVYIDDSQEPECDEIVVGYDPTAYTTSEGEGRVELNIAVFSHPVRGAPRPFTLSVTTTDGSANAPDDYEAVRREIIEFNTGDTSQTHIIFINPDDICEDGSLEKFYSNIVLEIGQQVRVSPPRAIVYIDDSQEPECDEIVVGYDPTAYTTSEGEGRVELNIAVFSHPVRGAPRPFTLSVTTTDGSANAPDDYVAVRRGFIEFNTGDTSQTHIIYINPDDICESDQLETFYSNIVLEIGQQVRVSPPRAIVYIDDSQEPECDEIVVGYDPTAYTTSEAEGRVVLNITVFSHPVRGAPRPFTLSVTTTDGSANAPDDYVAVRRGLIEFNTGDTSQTHIIFINPDDICESDQLEKFYSNIVLEIGQQVRVSPPRAIVYIDDSQEPECDEIVVGYDPTAYTTSEGEGRVELNIAVFSHPVRGAPRPFTLSVTTTDGSANAPDDYVAVRRGFIEFNTGDTSQTHIIFINPDDICEDGSLEKFYSNIVLEIGQQVRVSPPRAIVYIDDSQEPECDEIVVGYDPTAYTTSEGEGRVVLNITVFSHPVRGTPRPFTLSVTTTDGSAESPEDYQAVRREIIQFNTGDISQTHIIIINPDDICEDDSLETFFSNIVVELGQQVSVFRPQATVYIDDSQEPECGPIIVGYVPTVYRTSETQGSVVLNIVVLSHPVGGAPQPFTLSVTTTDGSAESPDDYQAVRREIIEFNTGDTSQTHIIIINPDDICEDDRLESFTSTIDLESIGLPVSIPFPDATVLIVDSLEPECNIVCSVLTDPANGVVSVTGQEPGDRASYTCFPGFFLRGVTLRMCQTTGVWSFDAPTCEQITCPNLQDPINGVVTLTGNTPFSVATYVCNSGYELQGVQFRTCQLDGQWSDQAPTCIVSLCPPLADPPNGQVSVLSQNINSIATYTCNEGFLLVGNATRKCIDQGEGIVIWTGQEPQCVPLTCPLLDHPKDGRVSFSSTSVGAVAVYECFPGYRLEGVILRTCQANGAWSDQEPLCRRIDCGLLPVLQNGDIAYSQGTFFRSVATYSCDAPFELIGSPTRVCQSDMQWSGTAPECQTILCEDLDDPVNGLVVVPSRLPGSTANYSCNPGYNLIGSSTRSCLNNGFWTGVVPICQLIDCGFLKPPTNGDVQLTGTTIDSIATYRCFQGYVLEGDEIRTCVDGGVWSGVDPVCNPVQCERLQDIDNGFVTLDGTSFGSTASYTCNGGFVLMGKGIRQCMDDGQWSGTEPRCEEVDCGTLSAPTNGEIILSGTTFGFTATYSCNKGFTAVGSLTRICQINSLWSGQEPTCIAAQCPELSDPVRGRVELTGLEYFDTATYFCDQGYVLSGSMTRTCQSNGVWTGNAPTCIFPQPSEVDCGQPPFLQNGEFSLSMGTLEGSQASYYCFRGYDLVGSTTIRTCLSSGQWSQEFISCQIIDCGPLPGITYGDVFFSSTQIDSQARYQCDSGFELAGVEIRICQDNGQWSGTAPSCVPVQVFTCDSLLHPVNGEVFVSGLTPGSLATYSCNTGYTLVGSNSRQCLDQQGWSGVEPTCQPVDCGVLQAPLNGQVIVMGTTLGSRAMYTCHQGYILIGAVSRICEADSFWSSSEPICAAVECGNLPDPVNGFVSLTDVTLGSVATYSCQTGYSLVGSTTRECGRNGRWTGVAPTCEGSTPTMCGDPGTPVYGILLGSDFRIGATVYYECDVGFTLVGPGSRQCQSSGIWTGHLPQCVEVVQTCEEGATVYDDCWRRCMCRGGALVDCCRVRRDFAALSVAERQRYIETVFTAATDPQYKDRYEELVNKYADSVDTLAQDPFPGVSQFFPWTRFFLLEYEDLLQEVDCAVTIPFWDWTALPLSPYLTPVWNPASGFGDSAREKDGCVENGPFRFDLFEIVGGGCLQRDYRMQMFPTRQIIEQDLLTLPAEEYALFHQFLQIFLHMNVRCFVGGQMCSDTPANDPVYLLHLAQIDSILSRWQDIDPAQAQILASDNSELVLTGGSFVVSDFADNDNLPGGERVCYEPADFKSHVPSSMQFMARSLEQMTNSPSLHMTCVTDEQMNNVHMSPAALEFMHENC